MNNDESLFIDCKHKYNVPSLSRFLSLSPPISLASYLCLYLCLFSVLTAATLKTTVQSFTLNLVVQSLTMTLMMKNHYRVSAPANPSTPSKVLIFFGDITWHWGGQWWCQHVVDMLQVRMKEPYQWWKENYFPWWKRTKVTAGPEYGGTWKRRDTSPPPTSKSSWTAVPKVLWPTYDLHITSTWVTHVLHMSCICTTYVLHMS